MLTLKNILHKSIIELAQSGIPTPELDARILLEKTLRKDSAFILSHPEYKLKRSELPIFNEYLNRRKVGEPIAYILGHKEFFGLDFNVNKNVLIPRPETEWLVEKSIAFLQNYELRIKDQERPSKKKVIRSVQDSKINLLDMGTGSGNIIVSLAKNIQDSKLIICDSTAFYATDISKKAIEIARKNAKRNKVEKYIKFYYSNLFSNRFLNKKFDLIIANLPYVPHSAYPKQSKKSSEAKSIKFEPKNAIFAQDNGTAVIKKFLLEAKNRLKSKGMILLEVDCRNAKEIISFAKIEYPKAKIELKKDLAGLDRYIEINTKIQ